MALGSKAGKWPGRAPQPGLLTPSPQLSPDTTLPSPSSPGIGRDGEGLGLLLKTQEVVNVSCWPLSGLPLFHVWQVTRVQA